MVGLAPALLVAVVDAVAPRQQPQAADPAHLAVEGGHALGVPAERAGAEAAEDHAAAPRLGEDRVEAVGAPGAEHADDAAAADVDQVLGEQVLAQVGGAVVAAEQRDVRRLADAAGEGPVEADDVVVGVTARGREEADPRPLRCAGGRSSTYSSSSGLPASIEKPPPPKVTIWRASSMSGNGTTVVPQSSMFDVSSVGTPLAWMLIAR